MSERSSNTSQTASAFYDPASSCWRMSQGSLLSEAPELLDRLPPWGTTAAGGLYELPMPALLIGVRDGSALLGTPTLTNAVRSERFRSKNPNPGELANLLATPTAWLGRRPAHVKGDAERWHNPERSNELSDQMAALLPTPRAQNAEPRNTKPWIRPLDQPQNLENAIARLLPTPVVNDMGRGKTVEEWDSWTDEMKERHGNGNGHGPSLEIEAARLLLPTPAAWDGARGPDSSGNQLRPSGAKGTTNLAGALEQHTTSAPTRGLSNDGNTSSDGEHPSQSTTPAG